MGCKSLVGSLKQIHAKNGKTIRGSQKVSLKAGLKTPCMVAAAQRAQALEVEAIASVQNPVPFCDTMVCSVGSLGTGEALNAAKVVQENTGVAAGLGRKRQAAGRRQNKA
jgi:hypothetical protein